MKYTNIGKKQKNISSFSKSFAEYFYHIKKMRDQKMKNFELFTLHNQTLKGDIELIFVLFKSPQNKLTRGFQRHKFLIDCN